MRELIKQVLEETIQRKYNRLTPDQYDKVYKLIGSIFKGFKLEWMDKDETYGDVRVNFCRNGRQMGYFVGGDEPGWDDDDNVSNFSNYATLTFDKSIINQVQSVFNIRKALVLNLITEFFEDNYLDDISRKFGIQFNDLDDVDTFDFRGDVCNFVLDQGRPELSREKMIEYIVSNTLFRKAQLEGESDAKILQLYKDAWRKVKREELGQ